MGKDLAARALHKLSPTPNGPFVPINCSSIAETLAESELFGYVKGAFTGATQDKVGLFEYANGGTAMLDEIGDMPLTMQSKLLRVLQNQELQSARIACHAKTGCARGRGDKPRSDGTGETGEVQGGPVFPADHGATRRFRRSWNVPEDLALLERRFIKRFSEQFKKPVSGLTQRAQELLAGYSWPGNIRELENVIGHACMMTESQTIDIRDLPETDFTQTSRKENDDGPLLPLAQVERNYIERVLNQAGGNKVLAAKILGISRTSIYRILSETSLDKVRENVELKASSVASHKNL